MASVRLGSLYINFTGRTRELLRSTRAAEVALRRHQRRVRSLRNELSGFNSVARRAAAALAAFGAGAGLGGVIRQLAEYEQSMALVRGITNATGNDFQRLDQLARDLGRNTRFSAAEAAQAMVELARAGNTVNEQFSLLPATLNLAAASGATTAEVGNQLTNIINQFGLSVADAERITDTLVTTTNSANTNFEELTQALSYVGPIARQFGIDVETTEAAIGALGNAGIFATRAGRGFRGFLASLAAPSGAAAQSLASVGLSLDDVSVASLGLIPVLENLRRSGIDSAEIFNIFGRENASVAEILIRNVRSVEDLTTAIRGGTGAAQRMADLLNATLIGQLRLAASAAFGFVQAVDRMFGVTTELTNFLSSIAGFFNQLTDNLDRFRGVITATGRALLLAFGAAAVLRVRRGLVAMRRQLSLLTRALGLVRIAAKAAFRALLVGAIIEGVILLIDAFLNLSRILREQNVTWGELGRNLGLRFVANVVAAIATIPSFIVNSINAAVTLIVGSFYSLGNALVDAIAAGLRGESLSTVIDEFTGQLETGLRVTGKQAEANVAQIAQFFPKHPRPDAGLFWGDRSRVRARQ